jgi:TusA-related sulfurtransferase
MLARFAIEILTQLNSPGMPKTNLSKSNEDLVPDRTLDITAEVCPMTFVRTRLALDRLSPGQTLLVLLRGDEPRRNVPASAAAQGHEILWQETDESGVTRLLLRHG